MKTFLIMCTVALMTFLAPAVSFAQDDDADMPVMVKATMATVNVDAAPVVASTFEAVTFTVSTPCYLLQNLYASSDVGGYKQTALVSDLKPISSIIQTAGIQSTNKRINPKNRLLNAGVEHSIYNDKELFLRC